ncbi:hypothetical protein Q1695_000397 [Nippostrongylus brasiliensis]|nr:hypothetical protein Q1695_000397 [Nippostrongylus brasiliensis]
MSHIGSPLECSLRLTRMLRFLLQKTSPEVHDDAVSDYLDFQKTVRHGFPSRVTCFAYDDVLKIIAIGNGDGDVNIYGGNGLIWSSEVPGKKGIGRSVAHMYFVCGIGVLIVLCRDSTFVRFAIDGASLTARSVLHETRLKKITSCCMLQRANPQESVLLIGTVSGNVFALDINTLELSEYIVFEETLLQRIPENCLLDKYPVDLLSVCSTNPRLTVMVFNHCLVILYDSSTNELLGTNLFDVPCKSITWNRDGSRFVFALHDGSYASCDSSNASTCERPAQVFGPFPCIPTRKVFFAETSRSSERIVLFSGGMPHASYGDRFVVTARQGDRTCVFDFPSPVVDFCLTTGEDGYHSCAIVLTENEVVCIDLTDRHWRVIPTEQIFPLHASQITTSTHCSHVEEHVWSKLKRFSAKEIRRNREYSARKWPIDAKVEIGDENRVIKESTKRQLWITGHENGTLRVWSAGDAVMQLLFVIDSRKEFLGFSEEEKDLSDNNRGDSCDTDSSDDDFQMTGEWPPFKKVGEFDPFCDDAGLSIQRIAFDEKCGQIVVGCRGGQVLIYSLEETEKELTPHPLTIEMCDHSKLGSSAQDTRALPIRQTAWKYHPGYQPQSLAGSNKSIIVQLKPALAVTAVAILSSRHLIAASNEYGFALVDVNKQTVLLQNSLVNQSDVAHVGAFDDALSRFKSMKKSIRQTFRKKKKTPVVSLDNTIGTVNSESSTREAASTNTAKVFSENEDEDVLVAKPVERLIEERGASSLDSPPWMIRCMRFLAIPVMGTAGICDVLVVGTNGGKMILYAISEQPRAEDVCKLLKTLALRHAAPIIHVDVIMEPGTKASSTRLVIFTEEQIRSFYLPSLKPCRYKVKLTSTEGLRIRKAAIVTLHNVNDLSNCESFATIVNNHGEVAVYSLLNPKKTEKFSVLKSIDIAGITSMLITPYGELLYLRQGGSEVQRATISEHSLPWTKPCQSVKLPESQSQ